MISPVRSTAACYQVIVAIFSVTLTGWAASSPQLIRNHDNVTYYDAHHPGPDRKHQVDVKPEPVGGMRALISRLDYPRELRHKGVTGTVRVRVSIDARGHVTSTQIVQSIHPVLDAIVLKAVRETPWNPARKNGKTVAWSFRFPVIFTR
jgi:TonB family protein